MKQSKTNILITIGAFVVIAILIFVPQQNLPSTKLISTTIPELQERIAVLWQQIEILINKIIPLDKTPPILSNLEPEDVTSNSGIITWGTNELSDSQVNYSTKFMRKGVVKNTLVATDLAWAVHHEVKLISLEPNTVYYYYVSSTDPSGNHSISNIHTITTLPE